METTSASPAGERLGRGLVRPVGVGETLAVAAIQAVFLVPISLIRVVDGDEGYYTMAAKLVAHGHTLYVDFWYQQAPLLPYVYGAWGRVFGQSWYSLRLLSCLLAIVLGALLYRHVSIRLRSRWLGAIAVLFYVTAPTVFQWFPVIKTYALSSLLLFLAYLFVDNFDCSDRDTAHDRWRWACAGVFAGLAADVRFVVVPALLVFLYYALRSGAHRDRRLEYLGSTIAGLAVGLAPSIYFFARGSRRFLNDTLTSQTTRRRVAFGASINQRLRVIGEVLSGPHFFIATAAVLTVVAVCVLQRRRIPMAIAIAAALTVANLLPTPTYDQYFCLVMPFLVVGALELIPILRNAIPDETQLARPLLICGAATIALTLIASAYQVDATRQQNLFLPRPSNIRTVSRAIDSIARPGEVVLSFWPGWLYETHAQPLPGIESDFIPGVAANSHLNAAQARHYHMLTISGIAQTIRSRRIRVIVTGYGFSGGEWPRMLAQAGYQPARTLAHATIYVRE